MNDNMWLCVNRENEKVVKDGTNAIEKSTVPVRLRRWYKNDGNTQSGAQRATDGCRQFELSSHGFVAATA